MKPVRTHSLQSWELPPPFSNAGDSGPFQSPTISVVFHIPAPAGLVMGGNPASSQRQLLTFWSQIMWLTEGRAGRQSRVCESLAARSEESGDSVGGFWRQQTHTRERGKLSVQLQTEGKSQGKSPKGCGGGYNTSPLNGQQLHRQDNSCTYTDRSQTITYFYWFIDLRSKQSISIKLFQIEIYIFAGICVDKKSIKNWSFWTTRKK